MAAASEPPVAPPAPPDPQSPPAASDPPSGNGAEAAATLVRVRKELAQHIAEGLAGWLQLQGSQQLDELPGEDSARFVLCQIVRAAHGFRVKTSQRPKPWPKTTKERIDIAIMGTTARAKGWNGAIEAKWPGKNFDRDKTRLAIIQDCARLASVEGANLNAYFLVLGGSQASLYKLFDEPHTRKPKPEDRRKTFSEFLSREPALKKKLTIDELKDAWGTTKKKRTKKDAEEEVLKAFARVPLDAAPTGTISAELFAKHDAVSLTKQLGSVFVWQISNQPGPRPKGNRAT